MIRPVGCEELGGLECHYRSSLVTKPQDDLATDGKEYGVGDKTSGPLADG